jgi:hypothetical protein
MLFQSIVNMTLDFYDKQVSKITKIIFQQGNAHLNQKIKIMRHLKKNQ